MCRQNTIRARTLIHSLGVWSQGAERGAADRTSWPAIPLAPPKPRCYHGVTANWIVYDGRNHLD